jgi:hypothetical protein
MGEPELPLAAASWAASEEMLQTLFGTPDRTDQDTRPSEPSEPTEPPAETPPDPLPPVEQPEPLSFREPPAAVEPAATAAPPEWVVDRELVEYRDRLVRLCRQRSPDLDDALDMDELAGKLYPRLRGLLRGELIVDRERAGTLADFR